MEGKTGVYRIQEKDLRPAILQDVLKWMYRLKIDHLKDKVREYGSHRRRICTEDKGNVVAAVWGAEFIQFLAALATVYMLHQGDLKNRTNSYTSSQHRGAIHPFLHIILVQNS